MIDEASLNLGKANRMGSRSHAKRRLAPVLLVTSRHRVVYRSPKHCSLLLTYRSITFSSADHEYYQPCALRWRQKSSQIHLSHSQYTTHSSS